MRRSPVSFLIPAYNSATLLPSAVASIVNGNLDPLDEIVIVNDGSTDHTQAAMEVLSAEVPQIRLFRHKHNRGSAAAARNTAIEAANHDLFFTLDCDNRLTPGSIDPLVEFLLQEKADVAAFREAQFFDMETGASTFSWLYPKQVNLADALAGHVWPGPQGNYLFTRSSWLKAGRYDEFVGGGLDSWVFGIRQLATGSRMVTMADSFYLHGHRRDSAWARDAREGGQSLKALRGLMPYLHLLEPDSVDYLFSEEGRSSWFENLENCPIYVRSMQATQAGTVHSHPVQDTGFFARVRRSAARKIGLAQ